MYLFRTLHSMLHCIVCMLMSWFAFARPK